MITIENAILFAIYYMIFGVVVSTYSRQIIKPENFKESLATTTIVILWPLVALFYAIAFVQAFLKVVINKLTQS
jgi:hypothetical protein